DSGGKVGAPNPRHKRWRVDGANIGDGNHARRARYPAPRTAVGNPAPVVERGKAPGRVIHPGPAPRRNPGPVAVTVRGPANDRDMWEPHRPVVGHRPPTTVVVQVLVADHVVRNVAARHRVLFTQVTLATPAVKIVFARHRLNVRVQRIGAVKDALIAWMQGI